MMEQFLFRKNTKSYLEPINGATTDQRWELSQTVGECSTDWTHTQQNVKILFTSAHKKIE